MADLLKPSHLFAQSIGLIDFDTLISEQHDSQLIITDYPVESGAPVSDHSYRDNDKLTLTVGHSITPFLAQTVDGGIYRLAEFYGLLRSSQAAGEEFEVGTGLVLYQNMVIQTLSCARNADNTTIISATVGMREVQRQSIYETDQFTQRFSQLGGVRDRAARTTNRGNTVTENVDDTDEAAATNRSWLKSGARHYRGQ